MSARRSSNEPVTKRSLARPLRRAQAMDEVIHEFRTPVRDPDGHLYRVRALGRARKDGTWIGWLEFAPVGFGGMARHTPRETTQPSPAALLYWALGIEPVYLEGAVARAVATRAGSAASSR